MSIRYDDPYTKAKADLERELERQRFKDEVFARFEQGETISSISLQLQRPTYSVRNAYIDAREQRISNGTYQFKPDAILISDLDLPIRVRNVLRQARIWIADDLFLLDPGRDGYDYCVCGLGPKGRKILDDQLIALGYLSIRDDNGIEIVDLAVDRRLDAVSWQQSLDYWNNCCAICGNTPSSSYMLEQDHWVPRASGFCPGTTVTNMVPLCYACNGDKVDKDPYLWLVKKFGKTEADRKFRAVLDFFDWWRNQEHG